MTLRVWSLPHEQRVKDVERGRGVAVELRIESGGRRNVDSVVADFRSVCASRSVEREPCAGDHHAPVADLDGHGRGREPRGGRRVDASTDPQSAGVPGLFGINAGATFFIILGSSLFSLASPDAWLWCAFIGAAVAGSLVWLIGNMGQGSLSPLRIVLAGAAMAALFSAFSQALLVVNQDGLDTVLFWLAGSLTERSLSVAAPLLLCGVLGLFGSMLLAGQVNVLNAGEEIATGLGQRTGLIRLMMAVLVVCLAGSAVALAGSIGFIGLLVPHMVRKGLSIDHRWMLPGCALLGAIVLLLADTLSRVLILPQEVPVGVMTALFGAPFFILLARRGGRYG